MKLYFKNFEIYHNISIYSQLPPIHMILSKQKRPRSPWEVHAEPLGLRGAQVGNLCTNPLVKTPGSTSDTFFKICASWSREFFNTLLSYFPYVLNSVLISIKRLKCLLYEYNFQFLHNTHCKISLYLVNTFTIYPMSLAVGFFFPSFFYFFPRIICVRDVCSVP